MRSRSHKILNEKRRPGRIHFSPLFYASAGIVLIWSLFGAAEVIWGFRGITIALAATVYVPVALFFGAGAGFGRMPRALLMGLALFTALCFLQLVPLPPSLWTTLPGSDKRAAVMELAGLSAAWLPISLSPTASTFGTLVAAAFCVFVASLVSLSPREFRLVAALLLALIFLGTAIGVIQVTSGGRSFAFYGETDAGALVGFYANKNHMALALVTSIALSFLLKARAGGNDGAKRWVFIGYCMFVAVVLPLTNSRAGLLLGLLVAFIIASRSAFVFDKRFQLAALSGFALLAVVFFATSVPSGLLERFGDTADDLRWPMLQHSLELWSHYWLFGSGLGSFAEVYMTYERLEWLFAFNVNNVHNDYVQLGLELGIGGLLALGLGTFGLISAGWRPFFSADEDTRNLATVGLAIVFAFALHSAVDYPLRRPAAVLLFGFGIAAICRAWHNQSTTGGDGRPAVR